MKKRHLGEGYYIPKDMTKEEERYYYDLVDFSDDFRKFYNKSEELLKSFEKSANRKLSLKTAKDLYKKVFEAYDVLTSNVFGTFMNRLDNIMATYDRDTEYDYEQSYAEETLDNSFTEILLALFGDDDSKYLKYDDMGEEGYMELSDFQVNPNYNDFDEEYNDVDEIMEMIYDVLGSFDYIVGDVGELADLCDKGIETYTFWKD